METNVRLIDEDQAPERVRKVYGDIRQSLAVPFVPDLFRALGAFPILLDQVWSEIRPLIGSSSFEGLAGRVRAHARACALQRFYVPDHSITLEANGATDDEIECIRGTVEYLHETDPRILVIAASLTSALSSGQRPSGVPMVVVAGANAFDTVGSGLAGEMKDILGVGALVGDLARLYRWSAYVGTAWNGVKDQTRSLEFRRRVAEIRDIAIGGLRGLDHPVVIDSRMLRQAGMEDEQIRQAVGTVEAFRSELPAIIQLIALFRVGLQPVLADQLLELEAQA